MQCVVTARSGTGLASAVVTTIDDRTGDTKNSLLTPAGGASASGEELDRVLKARLEGPGKTASPRCRPTPAAAIESDASDRLRAAAGVGRPACPLDSRTGG